MRVSDLGAGRSHCPRPIAGPGGRLGAERLNAALFGGVFGGIVEKVIRQSMRALNQLRQMVRDDPEAAKEVAELARQMQLLDPSRFPGNPAMLEQMHREVLSSVDKLELQLQRDAASTQARTGKSSAVPSGYQESVAEYYKRLSKNP